MTRKFYLVGILFFLLSLLSSLCAQTTRTPTTTGKKERCKGVRSKPVKYKVVSWYRGRPSSSEPEATFINVVIKPTDTSDERLRSLVRYLSQVYCKERRMMIFLYDSEEAARSDVLNDVEKGSAKADYLLDRDSGEENLDRITVINGRQVDTKISLDKLD